MSTNDISTDSALSFNISAYIISSNATVQKLGAKIFATLLENFKPRNITNIRLKEVQEYFDQNMSKTVVDVTIEWSPQEEKTCLYEIIVFTDTVDIQIIPISEDDLYKYTFKKLNANDLLRVAVIGCNPHIPECKSFLVWEYFDIKSNLTTNQVENKKN